MALPDPMPRIDPFAPDPRVERLQRLLHDHLERRSAWRPYVRRTVLGWRPDQDAPPAQAGHTEPFYTEISGPDAQLSSYWGPSDLTDPTPPADVDWSDSGKVTPRTVFVHAQLSAERSSEGYEITSLAGDSITTGPNPTSATVAMHMAEAMDRADSTAFAAGPATVADPVHGIGWYGVTTTTVGHPLSFDDLASAYWDMRALDRHPSVAWVSLTGAKSLRKEKDGNGALLFPPDKPLVLDCRIDPESGAVVTVPIVPLWGLDTGAIVADGNQIVAIHRLYSRLLVKLDYSEHTPGAFVGDLKQYLAREAVDFGVVPGQEASITRIFADS